VVHLVTREYFHNTAEAVSSAVYQSEYPVLWRAVIRGSDSKVC
jgi:hypothetical protein